VRVALLLLLCTTLAACTETPSYFPPCVDPSSPCIAPEGGADAADADASGGRLSDAPAEATGTDVADGAAPTDAPMDAIPDAP